MGCWPHRHTSNTLKTMRGAAIASTFTFHTPNQEAQAFANQNAKPASLRRQENQPVTGELLTGWLPTVLPRGSVVPKEIFEGAACRPS